MLDISTSVSVEFDNQGCSPHTSISIQEKCQKYITKLQASNLTPIEIMRC